jgi:hypothetical protein
MLAKGDKTYKSKLDVAGMGVSIVCAIHCVLLPVFLTTLPLFGVEILGNIVFETITIILSAIIGSWALFRGYRMYHHQLKPLVLFVVAMGFLVAANFYTGAIETILKTIAITGIITAHVLNWRYSKACDNPAHGHVVQ